LAQTDMSQDQWNKFLKTFAADVDSHGGQRHSYLELRKPVGLCCLAR